MLKANPNQHASPFATEGWASARLSAPRRFDALLDACQRLMLVHPGHALPELSQVAREAALPSETGRSHFSDKEAMLRHWARRGLGRVARACWSVAQPKQAPGSHFPAVLFDRLEGHMLHDPAFWHLWYVLTAQPERAALLRRASQEWRVFLDLFLVNYFRHARVSSPEAQAAKARLDFETRMKHQLAEAYGASSEALYTPSTALASSLN
jgi:AcrR family transcriptional regulator